MPPSVFSIFCSKLDFQKARRVPLFTVVKNLRFLSLRYSADFRRSRLVCFFRPQTSHCSVHFLQKLLKLLRPSPANANLVQRVPLPFFRHWATFFEIFLMSQKGTVSKFPLRVFCNRIYVNKSQRVRPPFYIFRHYATFSERKKS